MGVSLLDKGREEAQLRATETPSPISVHGTILLLLSRFPLTLSDAGFLFTVVKNEFLFNRFKILRTGKFERDIGTSLGRWLDGGTGSDGGLGGSQPRSRSVTWGESLRLSDAVAS